MKTKLITVILTQLLCFLLSDAVAQTKVDVNSIAVMKYNDHTKGLLLGDPIQKAIALFGNPVSISTELSEMDQKQMTLYKYGTHTILYFIDGVLDAFTFDIGTPFTVGVINGPALTTASSSIANLGWNLTLVKQKSVNIGTPLPGGPPPLQIQLTHSGDIFAHNVNTDTFFQVVFIQNGAVKSVMTGSR